ncbi:MAG: helix-turn-helix domain-containing protein [Rhodocyclaceae bacterium]|jgi:IS30 family transposase|nr:helix-turn-helix domain-containing protein [Rhodocyclaceae bacterium]MCE2724555.1 helix-turn-helix domain-containing protein [Betaproteobacteria bacterium]MCA3027361.1 helix-turn-helix domain-containing protein [Rhodocyclaceae bacterium]MCA3032037.1 helix-turn-helix domain-containing protein [Rhodocyclaceae bacterium]MCA3037526.1 helix-turn-helix domain-containing protein [Rhodocyclaceae bacterium]
MKRLHLTLDERYPIQSALLGGFTLEEIALELMCDRSTIHDEVKRGRKHRLA